MNTYIGPIVWNRKTRGSVGPPLPIILLSLDLSKVIKAVPTLRPTRKDFQSTLLTLISGSQLLSARVPLVPLARAILQHPGAFDAVEYSLQKLICPYKRVVEADSHFLRFSLLLNVILKVCAVLHCRESDEANQALQVLDLTMHHQEEQVSRGGQENGGCGESGRPREEGSPRDDKTTFGESTPQESQDNLKKKIEVLRSIYASDQGFLSSGTSLESSSPERHRTPNHHQSDRRNRSPPPSSSKHRNRGTTSPVSPYNQESWHANYWAQGSYDGAAPQYFPPPGAIPGASNHLFSSTADAQMALPFSWVPQVGGVVYPHSAMGMSYTAGQYPGINVQYIPVHIPPVAVQQPSWLPVSCPYPVWVNGSSHTSPPVDSRSSPALTNYDENGGQVSREYQRRSFQSPCSTSGPKNSTIAELIPSLAEETPQLLEFEEARRIAAEMGSGWSGKHGGPCSSMASLPPMTSSDFRAGAALRGKVAAMSKDHIGSRLIQTVIEGGKVNGDGGEVNGALTIILEECYQDLEQLITDIFGNYVIQRLIDKIGEEAADEIYTQTLQGRVLVFSLHVYGCRVVQKVLERSSLSTKLNMSKEIEPYVLYCIGDQNANHVVQKVLETVCPFSEEVGAVVNMITAHALALSRHPFGCRLVQRLLQYCTFDAQNINIVTDAVLGSVLELSQDQYGNYVVQHLAAHGPDRARAAIVNALSEKAHLVAKFSCHKYASNVVETCFKHGTPDQRVVLARALLEGGEGGPSVPDIAMDQYGNYVIQRALEVMPCEDVGLDEREQLLLRLLPHLDLLRKSLHGKHILSHIEQVHRN